MSRVKGFVCAIDEAPHGRIYKVRVKDPTSKYDRKKFTVASTHGNITLAEGLNVTFEIGTRDNKNGDKVLFAVDVSLETQAS